MSVIHDFSLNRVVYGAGAAARIGEIAAGRGHRNVLVVTDRFMASSGLVERVRLPLESAGVRFAMFTEFDANPTEGDAERCAAALAAGGHDAVLAVGGGSSIDVAKAAAILVANPPPVRQYFGLGNVPRPGLPILAVPTTSGTGSEATNIAILRDEKAGTKGGIVSPRIIPDVAVVDPELTLTLPAKLTAATGMDALCHAVEGFTSTRATPFTDMLHREAIRLIARNLRAAVRDGNALEARSGMSLAATLAGAGLVGSSATAGHALSYCVEGVFHVAHGEACSALLPWLSRFNAVALPDRYREIAILMGRDVAGLPAHEAAIEAAEAVRDLAADVGIPTLRRIGVTEGDLDRLAAEALSEKNRRLMANNPRRIGREEAREIFRSAL